MNHAPSLNLGTLRHSIGLRIFLETHRRVFKGDFGRLPKPLQQDCWDQGGYCLDAPEEMPAGGCANDTLPVEDHDQIDFPVQQVVRRE